MESSKRPVCLPSPNNASLLGCTAAVSFIFVTCFLISRFQILQPILPVYFQALMDRGIWLFYDPSNLLKVDATIFQNFFSSNLNRLAMPTVVKDARPFQLYFKEELLVFVVGRCDLSVIVPALNEERYIERCLKSVHAQTYKNWELIVCDNGSVDRTPEIAALYANRVVIERQRGIAYARNTGARASSGKILVFVDADTELPPDLLEGIVVNVDGYIGVTFSLKPIELDRELPAMKTVNLITRLSSFLGYPLIPGNCIAIKRQIFEMIRGFNPKVARDDVDLSLRARKYGRFLFLTDPSARTSIRRIRRYGLQRMIAELVSVDMPEILSTLGVVKCNHIGLQENRWWSERRFDPF